MEKSNRKNGIIIAAVVLIMAAALGMGMWLLNPNKAGIAVNEIVSIAETIHSSYKNSPGYWGLDTKFVIKNNLVKNVQNDKIIGVLGKEITIGEGFASSTSMPGSKTFDIAYKGLDFAECISLASVEFNDEQKLSLVEIIIKSEETEREFFWGNDTNGLPISRDAAKEVCKKNNAVLWRFQ